MPTQLEFYHQVILELRVRQRDIWTWVKNKYREKQIQNENLKKQIKRLKEKLNTYDDLVQILHRKQFLTDNASVHLQVNYKSCKRYF